MCRTGHRRLPEWLRAWIHWPERHRWAKRGAIVLSIVVLVLVAVSPWYGIYVRDDQSLPQYSFFLVKKGVRPERGDYVAFEMAQEYADRVQPPGFQRPYARVGQMWLKQVIGVEGDEVRVQGRTIAVNGQQVATVIERDVFKQPVAPAVLQSPIPVGQLYLGLPHPRSFDSRVIGYVALKDVKGVVWPIF